ncbi:MAG: hypothetical protein MJE68_25675 [Proteobacteria bacterium]|nr:hypothetical protein [Pseudomonadota bacterium]
MVRLNAVQCQAPPTSIESYCLDTDSIDIAAKYRVVIATCVTAGGLHRLRLSVGHFTHIFVDESGQATEPECLLPVSLGAGFKDTVVSSYIIVSDDTSIRENYWSRQTYNIIMEMVVSHKS